MENDGRGKLWQDERLESTVNKDLNIEGMRQDLRTCTVVVDLLAPWTALLSVFLGRALQCKSIRREHDEALILHAGTVPSSLHSSTPAL